MPMTLTLETDAGLSEFILKPIGRTGAQRIARRIAVDPQGRECRSVHLTHDGVMLSSGCSADLHEDADGNAVDKGEILQTDAEGNTMMALPATLGRPQRPVGPIPADEVLEHTVTRAYSLVPTTLARDLSDSLASGDIYRVPFRPRASVVDSPAFLLAHDSGIFLLRCEERLLEFIRLDQAVVTLEDTDEDSWDGWGMDRNTTALGGDDEW